MQARSTEGAVFHPGEYFFASTQHDLFRSLANAWLSLQLAGEIRDLAAKGAERGRVTDCLILNYLPGNRAWVSGAVISDYQAVIRCRE